MGRRDVRGAVQAGHKYALRNDYDIDVQFDGDGQHPAAQIKDLVDKIDAGAELVIGSRFLCICLLFCLLNHH